MQFIGKLVIVVLLGIAGYLYFTLIHIQNQQSEVEWPPSTTPIDVAPEQVKKEPEPIEPKKMYKWTDESGKVHFGDKPPQTQTANVEDVSGQQVQTTKFAEAPKIKPIYIPRPNRSSHGGSLSRKDRCKKLKAQVDKDMKSDDRLYTRAHHAKRQREKDTRWEMIKNCN